MEVTVELARRAGVPVFIPADVAGACCGTPFSSKGLSRAHAIAINAAVERCWRWSEQGNLPIVIDTSPCTYGFKTARAYLTEENQERFDRMTFLDAIEFVHDELLAQTGGQDEIAFRCAASGVLGDEDGNRSESWKTLLAHVATKSSSRWTLAAAALPAIAASSFLN